MKVETLILRPSDMVEIHKGGCIKYKNLKVMRGYTVFVSILKFEAVMGKYKGEMVNGVTTGQISVISFSKKDIVALQENSVVAQKISIDGDDLYILFAPDRLDKQILRKVQNDFKCGKLG